MDFCVCAASCSWASVSPFVRPLLGRAVPFSACFRFAPGLASLRFASSRCAPSFSRSRPFEQRRTAEMQEQNAQKYRQHGVGEPRSEL